MMAVDGGWGPHFCKDGSTVFRLWAPAESSLKLDIDGRQVVMERQDEGWFAVRLDHQPVDALYCYVLSDGRRVPDPAFSMKAAFGNLQRMLAWGVVRVYLIAKVAAIIELMLLNSRGRPGVSRPTGS
jgi:hypothetical protein